MKILRDNKGNMYRIQTFKYCTDYKGDPKPILPEDSPNATRMPDGSYKCLTCKTEEIQDRIVRVAPNSQRAKEIPAERKIKQEKEKRIQELGSKNEKHGCIGP